ncbi:MAG: hypothetical protein ACQUHE_05835 [Bacteroidia bacterium]
MEIKENNAGLGKNHDEEAREHDIAKKQSEAKPAAENLDMMPNSVNANGTKGFLPETETPVHEEAKKYVKEEHRKAKDWEDHSK